MFDIYKAKQEYYANILCYEMREMGFYSEAKSLLEIQHKLDADEYEKKGRFRVDGILLFGFGYKICEKYSNVYEKLSYKTNEVTIPYHLSGDSEEQQEEEDKNQAMINRDIINIEFVTDLVSCSSDSKNEKAHWTSIIASMDAKLNPFLHHE